MEAMSYPSLPFTRVCESDFIVIGMQDGEEMVFPVRIVSTLIAVSVTSSWCSWPRISRLRLFFAHWLSGTVMSVGYLFESMMISVCWAERDLEGFIKTLKFVQFAASHMLAITNLAICVNLALIVSSHRTMTRVKSVSSLALILSFLWGSILVTATTVPFWDNIFMLGTGFWFANADKGSSDFINVSMFHVEFIVGISMFFIVAWLLVFRMKEVKECWKLHRRIRYYFGLTALGTVHNLALGVCGTINVVLPQPEALLTAWSWMFRYIHIALDTFVLYGVLRETNLDERVDGTLQQSVVSSHHQEGLQESTI